MRAVRLLPIVVILLGAAPAAQIDPRAALIERGAWSALNAGQARAAAEGFRDALAADPRNARLHLGAGMAAPGTTTAAKVSPAAAGGLRAIGSAVVGARGAAPGVAPAT